MTFNPNADVSGNKVRRRGRTAAIAGGGTVGILGIIALIAGPILGIDLSPLVGLGQQGTSQGQQGGGQETAISECETGADANDADDCRIAATTLALDSYWDDHVEGYSEPETIVVDGSTATACGTASNQVGPFYCPADQGVYIDPTFFQILRQQFGATGGELAQVYILAHEYGHHVQHLTGVMEDHPNNGTGPESNGVRTELQADCYAGSFISGMTEQVDPNGVPYLKKPTETQLEDALNAALSVGDDHIQEQSGFVNPESFTHGTSDQRQFWFANGYKNGLGTCDTFAPGVDLR